MLGMRCCLSKAGGGNKPEVWTLGKTYPLFDHRPDLGWVRARDDSAFVRLLRKMGEGNYMWWESNEGSQFELTLHGGDDAPANP